MERIILQGTPREVLDRLRELLDRPGTKDETVQVTVEPAPDLSYAQDDRVAEALRRGLAEADRGELIEHERVLAWLESLGSDHEKPMPKHSIEILCVRHGAREWPDVL
jgi:predicted transcriptional regulator